MLGLGLGLGVGNKAPMLPASSWPTVADIPPGAVVRDSDGVVKKCFTPSGSAWQTRTSAADNGWYSICLHTPTGRLVAVANTGTGNRVMTSDEQNELRPI